MKRTRLFLAIFAVVAAFAWSAPASAQFFKWGPKLGVNINHLSLNKEAFTDDDNRAGFTGGLMCEFTVPVIGVGVDVSAMYVRRSAQWMENQTVAKSSRDYIDIPLNLKWKVNIPLVNNIIRPFITTGPSFAFLVSKKSFENFTNKKCDVAWNFGAGVELLKHVQIAASYGLGMSKAVTGLLPGGISQTDQANRIEGKNRYWTVTAAYLF